MPNYHIKVTYEKDRMLLINRIVQARNCFAALKKAARIKKIRAEEREVRRIA